MFRKKIGEGWKSGQVQAESQQRACIFVIDNGYTRMCVEDMLDGYCLYGGTKKGRSINYGKYSLSFLLF